MLLSSTALRSSFVPGNLVAPAQDVLRAAMFGMLRRRFPA